MSWDVSWPTCRRVSSIEKRKVCNMNEGTHFEQPTLPKQMPQHIIQCPCQTGLPPPSLLSPLSLPFRALPTQRPPYALHQPRLRLPALESFIPRRCSFHAPCPGGLELVRKISCLLLGAHAPQVGRLERALEAEHHHGGDPRVGETRDERGRDIRAYRGVVKRGGRGRGARAGEPMCWGELSALVSNKKSKGMHHSCHHRRRKRTTSSPKSSWTLRAPPTSFSFSRVFPSAPPLPLSVPTGVPSSDSFSCSCAVELIVVIVVDSDSSYRIVVRFAFVVGASSRWIQL
jgi:hypothetical protein